MLKTFATSILWLLAAVLITPIIYEPYETITEDKINSDVEKLPKKLRSWHNEGSFVKINGHNLFYVHKKQNKSSRTDKTVALIHGFPSSSYDYKDVIDGLAQLGYDVIAHDHLGFGFSDKPRDFTYSLTEAAEVTLQLWRKLEIAGDLNVVSHDMGDSVAMEIMSRSARRMLPEYFNTKVELKQLVLTNGGINYERINFRLSQKLLSHKMFGSYFNALNNLLGLSRFTFPRQLATVFARDFASDKKTEAINSIMALNDFKGGTKIMNKLIFYLNERPERERKWYGCLGNTTVRLGFVWGDQDPVNPLSTAKYVVSEVLKDKKIEFKVLKGAGHFLMIENPEGWLNHVSNLLELNR